MRGPFLRAFPGGLYPGSPEYDKSSVVYYPYDVEHAKELLAELGLKDTDGNDILNFTDGSPGRTGCDRGNDHLTRRGRDRRPSATSWWRCLVPWASRSILAP